MIKLDAALNEFIEQCVEKRCKKRLQEYKDSSPESLKQIELKHLDEIRTLEDKWRKKLRRIEESLEARLNKEIEKNNNLREDLRTIATLIKRYNRKS